MRDGPAPSLVEPRRRAEKALASVARSGRTSTGVPPRRVAGLVCTLGMDAISRSQVSRICQGLDEEVCGFRERSPSAPPHNPSYSLPGTLPSTPVALVHQSLHGVETRRTIHVGTSDSRSSERIGQVSFREVGTGQAAYAREGHTDWSGTLASRP